MGTKTKKKVKKVKPQTGDEASTKKFKKVKKIKKAVEPEETQEGNGNNNGDDEAPPNETKAERRKRLRKLRRQKKREEQGLPPTEGTDETPSGPDPRVAGLIGTKKGETLFLLADEQQNAREAFANYSSSGSRPTNISENHPEIIKAIAQMNYNEINDLRHFLRQLYSLLHRSAREQGVIG